MKSLATQTVVRNTADVIQASSGGQGVNYVELYGIAGTGTNTLGQADISDVLAAYIGGPSTPNRKFIFGSAVLDLTLTNQGTDEGPTGTVEVDVYRCVYRKKTSYGNPVLFYQNSASELDTMVGGSTLGMTTRGWTPFNCPTASQYVKILSKKKFLLSDGQTCTYQIRDPKNRYFNTKAIAESPVIDSLPGYTQFLLMVMKHVPANQGPAPLAQVVFGVTRSYTFKIDEESRDESAFV